MGGGKGGSDFDPKGKSDGEIMRFCQSFMTELCKHIGPDCDVPAGDIGTGAREIGYMFGQYKRIRNEWSQAFLQVRDLHTAVHLHVQKLQAMVFATSQTKCSRLTARASTDKTVVISGSGNVAIYATEKGYTVRR